MGPIERPSLLFNRSLMHMLSCDVHEYPPHTCQTAKWGLTLLSLCRVPKGHWDGVSQFLSMRLFAHRTPLTACERPRFMLGHDALCNSVSGASRLPLAPQFRTKASSRTICAITSLATGAQLPAVDSAASTAFVQRALRQTNR